MQFEGLGQWLPVSVSASCDYVAAPLRRWRRCVFPSVFTRPLVQRYTESIEVANALALQQAAAARTCHFASRNPWDLFGLLREHGLLPNQGRCERCKTPRDSMGTRECTGNVVKACCSILCENVAVVLLRLQAGSWRQCVFKT